jgi:hypothetical protein
VIDQLLEILKNTSGIYTAFVLDGSNEFSAFDDQKFQEDVKQIELVETLLPSLNVLQEFRSLNIKQCSFKYSRYTCNIYLTKDLSFTVIYENNGEFEDIEPIVKEILESI